MTDTKQNSPSEHKLAAIMFTDIVGYTSAMETDEAKALKVLRKSREIQKFLIAKYSGKWVKEMGDGVLAEFSSAYNAVCCAVDIQDEAKKLLDCKIRIGIHLGEVTVENDDIFGDGVNIASRIQSITDPGGIFVSESIKKAVHSKADIELGFLGKINLKNVAEPISTFYLKKEFLPVPTKQRTRDLIIRQSRLPLIFAIVIPLLLLLPFYWFVIRDSGVEKTVNKTIELIAILPFSNNKPDTETDYLGFAIANQVIGDLSYINSITVRPASSIRKYVGQSIDPLLAGDDLNVDYIVMGNYLKEGSTIRVAVELMEVKTHELIWREAIELDFSSAFELQDIVAKKVIDELNVQLSSSELDRLIKDIPANPLAYEYYLRSLSYPLTNEGHQLAIDMLNKSVEIDSSYAPAYSQLGYRNHNLAQYSIRGNDKFQISENYYLKALSLNEELIEALARMTSLYTETGRIENAVEAAKDLLKVNPNSAEAHYTLGYIYRYAGMNAEAVREMELAVKLDSTNQRFRSIMITYFTAGYYEKAIKAYENYEENPFTLYCLGLAYLRNGEKSLAAKSFKRGIELDPQDVLSYDARCLKYYIEGDFERALDEAQELEKYISGDSEVWCELAGYYGLLGYRDGCIRALRNAVDGGYFNYPFINSDPFLESVRDDPEFIEILALAKEKCDAFKAKFVE